MNDLEQKLCGGFVGIFAHHQLCSFEMSFRYLKCKTAKLFHLDGKKAI